MIIGGGARNEAWVQILSDILKLPISLPETLEEATSMGAAITAGVGIGVFDSFDAAEKFIKVKSKINPKTENEEKYNEMKMRFDEIYHSLEEIFEKL